jgi:site-specific DNA recombinase
MHRIGALHSMLPLAFLSPDIVQAIVRGVQPVHLTAKSLVQRIVLPLDWLAQRESLGFP